MTDREVFVDTGAWVALAINSDDHHADAVKIYPDLLKKYQKLITTNLVTAETYIILRKYGAQEGALTFLEKIAQSPRIEKVYSNFELEDEAFNLLKQFGDQDFSFTDAVSFCLMKKRRINRAFTFDRHFKIAGFNIF